VRDGRQGSDKRTYRDPTAVCLAGESYWTRHGADQFPTTMPRDSLSPQRGENSANQTFAHWTPEPEIRIPKPEIRKKSEARRPKTAARPKFVPFGFRNPGFFRASEFGIRISRSGGGPGWGRG